MISKEKKDEKILLSMKEACELTGLSEKTMRRLTYELGIQVRVGRRVMVHRKKLVKWIDQQTWH